MKAKLINEILRGTETASSALGIGKAVMTRGYEILNYKYPFSVTKDDEKGYSLKEIFERECEHTTNKKIKNQVEDCKDILEYYSKSSLDDFVSISLIGDSDTGFLHTDAVWEDLNLDERLVTLDEDEIDNGTKIIYSWRIKYDQFYNVGEVYFNNIEKGYDQTIHVLIVKYK